MLPPSDKVLYIFYDFETMQNTRYSDTTTVHVQNLVCTQQFCSRCESSENVQQDCVQCGKRKHSFWEDPVGDMLAYLCEPRPWVKQIIVIVHNAKAFDLHFILNRAILLKWRPELIMNYQKIMCMTVEHMKFIDSICFLLAPLRKLFSAFVPSAFKSWYPHYFNTEENLNYIGPIPDVSYYGVNERSDAERTEFLEWYVGQKYEIFDNRRVLESYCQDDVTVVRQAYQVFRYEFIRVGNIEVYLESVIIVSACNKMLRKQFLKPDTIGLIPTGGYSGNANYSKEQMWLIYREQTDGSQIMHGRNGREYRLPELPHLSVEGFCEETKTVYEFCGCYWYGHTCLPFRDVSIMIGDTLAETYERTMTRLEQITRGVKWKYNGNMGLTREFESTTQN